MLRRDFLKTSTVAADGLAAARVAPAATASSEGLLVEAAFFEDRGGWVPDTQFFREHGTR